MARDLADRIMVITGASSGIGRATALEAAKAGMHVVVTARRADRLDAVCAEVRSLGRKAHPVAGDVADPCFSDRLLDEATSVLGGFDVVFANAGYGAEQRVVDMKDDELRRMFEVNFFAANDLLVKAARRLRAARRGGHLLMCSSCVARFVLPGYGPYSATKAAQALVCRAMRYELAEHGIEVSSVHPVTTATEFFEVAGKASATGRPSIAEHAPKFFVQPPERVARAIVRCLRRPRSEVWTSFATRFAAGLFTTFPVVADLFLRPQLKWLPKDDRV